MRIDSDTAAQFLVPQGENSQRDAYKQGDAETLEQLVAAELVEVAKLNLVEQVTKTWFSLFVDVAGAGDGHVFMARVYSSALEWSIEPNSLPEGGEDPALLRMFFYQAAQSEALDAAAEDAKSRLAAEADSLLALDSVDSVAVRQTGLAGASQGTRAVGFLMAVIVPVLPTIASAVLDGETGDLTIDGTGFESTIPNTQTYVVIINGVGLILSEQQILAAGGSVTDTQIVVPASLIPGVVAGDDVSVSANGTTNSSAFFTIT